MDVTVDHKAFASCLSRMLQVVDRKGMSPVTGSVHLQCLDGRLVVSATNFNSFVQESMPAQTKDFKPVLTPAARLYEVVRKLDAQGRLTLSVGGGAKKNASGDTNLHVQSGRTKFSLVMSSPSDFVIPPYAPSAQHASHGGAKGSLDATMRHMELDRARLHLLFEATFFAASQDETREYLNGVYLHTVDRSDAKNGGAAGATGFYLRTVATDGHRMAVSDVEFPLNDPLEQGLVIPRAAIGQLTKIVASMDGVTGIRLGVVDQTLQAHCGDLYYECRTLGSNFPDYKRVIPQFNPQRLIVDRSMFRTVVDRVAIISDRTSRMIRLHYSDNSLQIRTQTEQGEEAQEDLAATMKGEGSIDIAFNADYVLETLAHIPHPFVALEIKDTASPVLLSGLMDIEDPISKAGFIDPKLLQGMVARAAQSSSDAADANAPPTARSQFVIMPMRI